jgi:hypothetical protein
VAAAHRTFRETGTRQAWIAWTRALGRLMAVAHRADLRQQAFALALLADDVEQHPERWKGKTDA